MTFVKAMPGEDKSVHASAVVSPTFSNILSVKDREDWEHELCRKQPTKYEPPPHVPFG